MVVDRIATALILLRTECNFGLHSRCDVNHKGNRRAKAKRALNAEFSYGVQCTDDLPTATAHIRAAESGRRMLITRGKVVYECQRLTKAKKKMFGNEPGHRTLKGSKRRRTMTALKKLAEPVFSSWSPKVITLVGELNQLNFTPKYSFPDPCSLIEGRFESHWTGCDNM